MTDLKIKILRKSRTKMKLPTEIQRRMTNYETRHASIVKTWNENKNFQIKFKKLVGDEFYFKKTAHKFLMNISGNRMNDITRTNQNNCDKTRKILMNTLVLDPENRELILEKLEDYNQTVDICMIYVEFGKIIDPD